MKRLFCALVALVSANFTVAPAIAAEPPLRVLYLTQSVGFVHQPVKRTGETLAPSETAMIAIGKESGAFTVEVTQDATTITPDRLKSVDVLVFYTTGALPISAPTWQAIQDWVASGKGGFVGLHSATDTAWPYDGAGESYTAFINGKFAGHPWTQGTPIRLVTHDLTHPASAVWGPATDYAEEIYQYSDYDPSRVRVLQSLDFTATALKRPYAVPVTWVRTIGKGRLFYTNLGHTPSTWNDPRYRVQVANGIKWAAGRIPGEATPDPDRQAFWAIRSLLAYDAVPAADVDATLQRLEKADSAWLRQTATRIAALRAIFPAKPDADRAPFETAYRALIGDVRAKAGAE